MPGTIFTSAAKVKQLGCCFAITGTVQVAVSAVDRSACAFTDKTTTNRAGEP